jgi:pyruvate dehydrogenase E2 component (dihydrolipoamide acetyltransferase)
MTTNAVPVELAPWPEVNFAEFGEVESVPVSRIQSLTAAWLTRNSVLIPHVTHHEDVDITEIEAFRKTQATPGGGKLTLLPFIVKAMAGLMGKFPKFNASLEAEEQRLVLKKYVHVGVAIDTPAGLLVGVVRDCDRKGVAELAEEIADLSRRAREKGLPMKDMIGGGMSVSSLGHIGGTAFTPIINAPEVAILGLTRARWVAQRASGDATAWRLMLPVSLSYDHRVINGADAARFTAALGPALDALAVRA